MARSCCIRENCGMPFDTAIPETRDLLTLRPFWRWYCPKHRVCPEGRLEPILEIPAQPVTIESEDQ